MDVCVCFVCRKSLSILKRKITKKWESPMITYDVSINGEKKQTLIPDDDDELSNIRKMQRENFTTSITYYRSTDPLR